MKNRKANFETVVPDPNKGDSDQSDTREVMNRPVDQPQKPEARLGREVQARIGQQLRSMYDEVVSEGVPQHITDLLRRLGEQE